MSESEALRVEQRSGHLRVTLNRPAVRNAIDLATVQALHLVCEQLEASPQPLVLTGAGSCFAGGADIAQLRERGPVEALAGINSRTFDRVARLPMPTVALVNGPAVGGGAELAYACDLRVATPSASFSNPEVGLGIVAAAGACWRLRELVGLSVAQSVLLGGRSLDAASALACGLVLDVVEEAEAEAYVESLVRRIGRGDPLALRLTKIVLGTPGAGHPFIDDVAQAVAFGSEQKERRMTAFLERSVS